MSWAGAALSKASCFLPTTVIMSEEALRMRRALRWQKQHGEASPTAEQEPGEKSSLTAEQEQLIEILTEAHKKHFDSSFSQFIDYQVSFSGLSQRVAAADPVRQPLQSGPSGPVRVSLPTKAKHVSSALPRSFLSQSPMP